MSIAVTRSQRIVLAVAAVSLFPAANFALATDGTWNSDATGTLNWSDTTKWLGGNVADGTDAVANFNFNITNNRTVTINGAVASRTLGAINFSDPTAEGTPATFKAYTIGTSGGGTLTLATTTGTPTIDIPNGLQSHIINAPLVGTQGLVKIGGGGLRLGGTNTSLTGQLLINEGTLRADSAGAFNNQPITVASGALAYHNATGANYGSNYTIAGDGPPDADNITRLGAIRFAQQSQIISGTITLTGDAGISSRGSVTATPATISGKITGGFALRLQRTSTTTSIGNGFLVLSNTANDWTGNTTIEDGTVRLGASNVIPNGSAAGNVILHNVGTNTVGAISDSVLDLNGFSESINGLSHSATTAVGDRVKLKVINGGASAAVLSVGDNNASGDFGGSVQNGTGVLGLTKLGSGTQTLSGANSYTGNTIVQAGTLALVSSTSNNNIANSANIIVGDTAAHSAAILDVTGITGGFQVQSAQTLGGHGTVAGGVTVNAGGTLAPGNSIGTLTRTGDTALNGVLKIELNDADANVVDLLNNTGGLLDISGTSAVDFDVTGTAGLSAYVFAKYGTLSGTAFGTVTDLPEGYNIDYNYQGLNQIALVAVPEPGAAMMLSMVTAGMMIRRRRSRA